MIALLHTLRSMRSDICDYENEFNNQPKCQLGMAKYTSYMRWTLDKAHKGTQAFHLKHQPKAK